jgi:hypothetical protein
LQSGESFGIICTREQVSRMERVLDHNGGKAEILKATNDSVYLTVVKI